MNPLFMHQKQDLCAPLGLSEIHRLLPGKVPPELLESLVFKYLGKPDPDLILGPGIGQDASLLRVGDYVLVASTDPITGSIEDVGWLAVHVNANDVATFGVSPRWFLTSIMLPEGYSTSDLERITSQIGSAAKSLDISVVGGHTEITEGLDRPIVAGFMLGITREGEYVTSSGAKAGDTIILTKTVGIEGTAILATEGASLLGEKIPAKTLIEAQELRSLISVVNEGLAAFQTGYITAMHDPTEGGLSGGIHELCDASGVGFEINFDEIPIHSATEAVCNALDVNVMELISSGCMIITCDSRHSSDVLQAIEPIGVQARIIGDIVEDSSSRLVHGDEKTSQLPRPNTDALWNALKKVTE
jgi:hydrogenase expression/formation protein HypE